jgi:predicted nuclease of restriction endonuclease-like (RecB) superfamily
MKGVTLRAARKAGPARSRTTAKSAAAPTVEVAFDEVVELIRAARHQAARAVNTGLIELYWRIGDYLHHKIESDGWAKGTVVGLAAHIARREPGQRGFSPQNLWRMRQFFVAYRGFPKLSPLLRELPWSSHLHILSGAKRPDEREFYLRLATQNRWPVREVARQIESASFEKAVLSPPRLSTALREMHPAAASQFKDAYQLDFLDLPSEHSEADLHQSLLRNLGRFLTELGRDFCFIGSEYPVQVGNQDFALDLLFFHRGLNCLLAIELKVTAFQPEHHENPAIGLLLCASKDSEVVEYALSRTLSPALVAEYQTQLPDKKLLAAKLHEFYALTVPDQIKPKSARKPTATTKKRTNKGAAK